MPKIEYSEIAISAIKGFIRAYEEAFFELYRDSGILAEKQIIENYRLTARKLSEQIFLEIENHLSVKKVLGRKESKRWNELVFYVGSRLITVYFSDHNDNYRVIEMIGIERKPIIF